MAGLSLSSIVMLSSGNVDPSDNSLRSRTTGALQPATAFLPQAALLQLPKHCRLGGKFLTHGHGERGDPT
jgi:hypothetical protein